MSHECYRCGKIRSDAVSEPCGVCHDVIYGNNKREAEIEKRMALYRDIDSSIRSGLAIWQLEAVLRKVSDLTDGGKFDLGGK